MSLQGRLVDAEPVREHVHKLIAAGMRVSEIEARSGVTNRTINVLLHGRPTDGSVLENMTPTTAQRLLAADVPGAVRQLVESESGVDSTGALRRLRALVADGHAFAVLARIAGMDVETFTAMLHGCIPVQEKMVQRARLMFDAMQLTPGTDMSARRYAAKQGWLRSMEWDEDLIDDPSHVPSRSARTPRDNLTGPAADRRDKVRDWMEDPRPEWAKGNAGDLATKLGVSRDVIYVDMKRIRDADAKHSAQEGAA
ncbi:hypothetical protein ACT17_15175 [Mycolicibacterium conceptionense]|uniref:Uncharacterized protein n=1 Tax=Mycolicibacterium conceptionense TaxID=451644 RepID=A0A0J8U9D5_9MYCO|nr:hypothetical protein [Mycolicibacterium conceptionense]KMV17622.1 hypothetical protein ACT17_15175 [Mycolicibacterium conceptionense]